MTNIVENLRHSSRHIPWSVVVWSRWGFLKCFVCTSSQMWWGLGERTFITYLGRLLSHLIDFTLRKYFALFRFILFLWLYCFLSLCVRHFVYVCAIFHLKKIALLSVLLGWLFTGEDFHQLTQLEILGPPETFFGGMQFLCSCTCNFPTRQICN